MGPRSAKAPTKVVPTISPCTVPPMQDSDLDPALVEVAERTAHLLAGQANPTGEQVSRDGCEAAGRVQ